MKNLALFAGFAALTTLAPVVATAQTRTVTTHTVVHTETRQSSDDHRVRRSCRVERHGRHRVRICRTVRD